MHWRARKPRLSVRWNDAQTYELVCAMTFKMHAAFIASLSVALTVASSAVSGYFHYTYTYDVPWDAVHRYPPVVSPSEPVVRPYVPGCPAQTVTVPMGDGKEQTVTIVR